MSNIYGEWLRTKREEAGMTQQELADTAIMTRSHIAHIEAGRRVPSREDARRLDLALGTGDVLSSFLPEDDSAIADHFAAARELEKQATVIREFGISMIPGILQTAGYARAIMRTAFPPWSDEECDSYVVTRLERAKILANPVRPAVCALLDEAVLRRPVGGPSVMAEQIAHVVRLAEVGRIRVHVIPFDLGAHPLMQGVLTMMWFEDQPPAAYTEGMQTGKIIDSPAMVDRLQGSYTLAMGDAMPLQESITLMKAITEEYERHG
ncbi:helix-turn-helix domain-containing protein [Streptomyces catenulae]|uniref:Helix-turn-helix transcriptional regulator n=1 Tax=Streptomyces catenulae TaxID=66875 RepID=A0ABV2Z3P9_9ACTN|nr:helix-turn-helix transcriptional regulator [Streptomyces catenulae]